MQFRPLVSVVVVWHKFGLPPECFTKRKRAQLCEGKYTKILFITIHTRYEVEEVWPSQFSLSRSPTNQNSTRNGSRMHAFVVVAWRKMVKNAFSGCPCGFSFRHFLCRLSTYTEAYEKPDCRSQIRTGSRTVVGLRQCVFPTVHTSDATFFPLLVKLENKRGLVQVVAHTHTSLLFN